MGKTAGLKTPPVYEVSTQVNQKSTDTQTGQDGTNNGKRSTDEKSDEEPSSKKQKATEQVVIQQSEEPQVVATQKGNEVIDTPPTDKINPTEVTPGTGGRNLNLPSLDEQTSDEGDKSDDGDKDVANGGGANQTIFGRMMAAATGGSTTNSASGVKTRSETGQSN